MTRLFFFLAGLMLILSPLFTTGCTYHDVHPGGPVVVEQGGPPPHAPAHGRRAKYSYYYYPDNRIYFDINRHVYFYFERSLWRESEHLPKYLRAELGPYVSIEMDTNKPYMENMKHVKKYPPGQAKKKGKGKNW